MSESDFVNEIPICTRTLKGTLPFTWSAEKIADYMVKNAYKNKVRFENSLFYSLFARLLRLLPAKATLKILGSAK